MPGKGPTLKKWEKGFDNIKANLTIDNAHRLVLASLPMILTPRMFFVNIQKKVEEICGTDTARLVFYKAAFESAYRYMENSREAYEISGKELLQQYLDSLSVRGWGLFEILKLTEDGGESRIRLHHSAISEEYGMVGRGVCHIWAGALAGAVKFITEEENTVAECRGIETRCLSKGDPYCEFSVEQADTNQPNPET